MAFKFFNIGKANAEILRLEQSLADVTKERDDLKAAIESNSSEVSSESVKQLEDANAKVTELTGKLATVGTDLEKVKADLTAANAELEKVRAEQKQSDQKIQELASKKAAEITGAQGQPPIAASPATSPGGEKVDIKNLKGLAKVIAIEKAESAAKTAK